MNAQLLPPRIEGIRTPRDADERTLRACYSEADAVKASIALSGLTYREIAARMGCSKTLVGGFAAGTHTLTRKRTRAFCNATGTRLIEQYRDREAAIRAAENRVRESDRIQSMIQPTLDKWRAA